MHEELEVSNKAAIPKTRPKLVLLIGIWIYHTGAVLVAAGFADFPPIAYHFAQASVVPTDAFPVFYAVAMGVSETGSLVFGRLYDRYGFSVLIGSTIISTLFALLAFLGGSWTALIGLALSGLGIGVHESFIPAAMAPMLPPERRAPAFGLFTTGYSILWFLKRGDRILIWQSFTCFNRFHLHTAISDCALVYSCRQENISSS